MIQNKGKPLKRLSLPIMAKYPRFFVAINPMADPEGEYIYHGRKPRFLAKRIGNHIELLDNIDNAPPEQLEPIYKRLADWYVSYKILKREAGK